MDLHTVNIKRFAGLNICGFSPMKIFVGIYCCGALASNVNYLTIAKYLWENFHSTLKTVKTVKA